MRHANIATTMKYYIGIDADDVAADLWTRFSPGGNTSGNTPAVPMVFSAENEG